MVDAAQVFSTQADETELVAQGTERELRLPGKM